MRKASAVVCSLFVMVVALAALALPAGAGAYPPSSTTPTSPPTTVTPPTTGTPPTTVTPPTTGTSPTSTPATSPPATSSQASNLAFTGSDSTPLVIIGIVAVTLGAVLVVAARRRSSVQAPRS